MAVSKKVTAADSLTILMHMFSAEVPKSLEKPLSKKAQRGSAVILI